MVPSGSSVNHNKTSSDLPSCLLMVVVVVVADPLFMVGFSLGANLTVKYLGEEGENAVVTAAVSISNPWCFTQDVQDFHYW